jgi:hypothetical protein
MDKRWYPVAFSVVMVGCSGDVDNGHPGATGGSPAAFYGIMITTGGSRGIDAGIPTATGGFNSVPYYGVISPAGGSSAAGGSTSIDGGTPAATGGVVMYMYGVMRIVGGANPSVS